VFTGIIEEVGRLAAIERHGDSAVLRVSGPAVLKDAGLGDSIAVNGVCLTVTGRDDDVFSADAMAETMRVTALGSLKAGDRVNLERPLRAGGRLDGHIVQGHVDGVGRVLERTQGAAWEEWLIGVPQELARYIARKGSIAVDGVSLTVTAVTPPGAADPAFGIGLIPATLAHTALSDKAVGAPVNLEVDILAKYVERLATVKDQPGKPASSVSENNPTERQAK
jgi:riboflavin synthase